MSQAGIVDFEGSHPQVPTSFVTNSGTAVPIANVLEVLGTIVAPNGNPLTTLGSGNTVTIQTQYSKTNASSVATNAGMASFNSAQFTVDGNGYVSLSGTGSGETITGNTGGALSPTAGNWNIFGTSTASGTIPVQTSGSGSTLTVQVQKAQAIASTNATNVGLAAFNSTYFTVDANGFVSVNGSGLGETITGNAGGALSPTAGNWNILGSSTAAGTTPVQTSGSVSTLTVQVQKAQAIASTNATNVGLAAFDSARFTVDGNGFVSINGAGIGETITGTVGGALSPTAGNWNIVASSTAAGTTPIQTSGSASTLTIQVQKAQAIASTNATNVGLAAFNSTQFTVDANGFVSLSGSGSGETITGNTGGALSPTAGNWNILGTSTAAGTTPVQTSGSVSTLTVQVQKAQAIASTNATNVGLAAFDSARFTVDANGFVSINGAGLGETITGNTGGALSPTSGNWNILGGAGVTTAGAGSTLTINAVAFTSTGATTLSINSGYFATGAGTYNLPSTSSSSSKIEIIADASGVAVTAGVGVTIKIGSGSSTSGGKATSNAVGDALTLIYRNSTTTWEALTVIGTWTLS